VKLFVDSKIKNLYIRFQHNFGIIYMNRYAEQIDMLSWIIKNWDLINQEPKIAKEDYYNTFGYNLSIKHGLCANAKFNGIPIYVRKEMFRTYKKWSGNYVYPLSDFENYFHLSNFTNTPERLELAKHCSKYLKNLVASIEKSGTI
jgi:hypothetical protein